jgi:hypothetical protein
VPACREEKPSVCGYLRSAATAFHFVRTTRVGQIGENEGQGWLHSSTMGPRQNARRCLNAPPRTVAQGSVWRSLIMESDSLIRRGFPQ